MSTHRNVRRLRRLQQDLRAAGRPKRALKWSIWITKDGRPIPVTHMDAEHLLNSIAYLARHHDSGVVDGRGVATFLANDYVRLNRLNAELASHWVRPEFLTVGEFGAYNNGALRFFGVLQ